MYACLELRDHKPMISYLLFPEDLNGSNGLRQHLIRKFLGGRLELSHNCGC